MNIPYTPKLPRYSIIRHIARGILFSRYRSASIVMLSAYLDTSGNRRTQSMSMAALVSTVQKWDKLQQSWPVFLSRHGVGSLHMTDFVSCNREFKGWSGPENSERRKRFIGKAITCVRRYAQQGFSASLSMADYMAVDRKYKVEEHFGPPLTICGMGIIGQVHHWAARNHINPKEILFFIEDGDEDKGLFLDKARSYGFNVQPVAKSQCKIFEACDMVAWKMSAGLRNAENKKGDGRKRTKPKHLLPKTFQCDNHNLSL